MVIAILTAKRGEIDGLTALLGFQEFLYLVLFVWIALAGSGAVSLDAWLARRFADRPANPHPGTELSSR